MDKPTMNYAVAYQRFRSTLNGTMINLQKEYPLPTYMIEGIVAGILADIRSAAIAESNSEEQSFAKENAAIVEETVPTITTLPDTMILFLRPESRFEFFQTST